MSKNKKEKNSWQSCRSVAILVNVILLITVVGWCVTLKGLAGMVGDYIISSYVVVFALCISLIFNVLKKGWSLVVGVGFMVLAAIGGFAVVYDFCTVNKPCIGDIFELPSDLESKIYYYKTNKDFDNLTEYENYKKYKYFLHEETKSTLLNDVKTLTEVLTTKGNVYYDLNKLSQERGYDDAYFENNSLLLYVYNGNTSIADIKMTGIRNEGDEVIVDLAIAEGKAIEDKKAEDGSNIYLPEHSEVLIIETEKIPETKKIVYNRNYYETSLSYKVETIHVDKPVLYFYPENKTDIKVELKKSENLTVSYPKYDGLWEVEAYPDGTLIDSNSKKYYSLYYEALGEYDGSNVDEGFVIAKDEVAEFLEEKLEILGLNYKEKEEFIIYWLPQLEENEYVYMRFQTREEIDENMPIEVSPKPDTFIRVMMEWKGLESPIEVREQKLEPAKREGFTVVEWGGSKLR